MVLNRWVQVETAVPPVFGKEEKMRLVLKLLLILLSSQVLFSIEFKLNNGPWENCDTLRNEYLYTIPVNSSSYNGISISEILPLMADIWKTTFYSGSGEKTVTGNDLAERLNTWYAVRSGGGWDVVLDNETLIGVKRIKIEGERIESDSLEVWLSWEGIPRLKDEIARFESLHNITIKKTDVPKIESKLLSVLRGGGAPPDIVMIQSDYLHSLVNSNALQNLDYMVPEDLNPKGLDAFRYENKIWGIPFYYDTQLLFYNKDLISEIPYGTDWSLDDFEHTAEVLRNKGINPITWNVYSAYWLIPFQIGFGKDRLINGDGSITINDPPTINALEYLLELQERELLYTMERDAMISLFAAGEIAMILSGSYSIPQFEELGLNFGIHSYPVNGETGIPVSPLLDFKAFAISRKTKNPILSRRLIEYLTGIGVQQRFPPLLSKLPSLETAFELNTGGNRYREVLRAASETGYPVPSEKAYGIYKSTMWNIMPFIITGKMTVETALDRAQILIDQKTK